MDEPHLTPREQEVLALLKTGKTNREIAAVLVISRGVVEQHCHHIFHKLNVRNRTEAALLNLQGGQQ